MKNDLLRYVWVLRTERVCVIEKAWICHHGGDV